MISDQRVSDYKIGHTTDRTQPSEIWLATKRQLESFSKATFRPRRQSWVGVYVDGYDYWTRKPAATEPEEVDFEIDKRSQTWYDLPTAEEVQIEIPMDETSEFVQTKIKMEKLKAPEEVAETADEHNEYTVSPRAESNVSLQEKRKMFSFDQREPLPEKISNDLYQMFRDFARPTIYRLFKTVSPF
ncbi:uncharacterized protein CEXT_814791 [Caerostris extrusa]|uniref:Uncharacterized protein n=1 Tax=Caerostris extrusa TaxID=172846 RepID=A0AAV4VN67_CAEEX|nr:uncharacterized protein CEXT_814791 [Caerostris extrusa]